MFNFSKSTDIPSYVWTPPDGPEPVAPWQVLIKTEDCTIERVWQRVSLHLTSGLDLDVYILKEESGCFNPYQNYHRESGDMDSEIDINEDNIVTKELGATTRETIPAKKVVVTSRGDNKVIEERIIPLK